MLICEDPMAIIRSPSSASYTSTSTLQKIFSGKKHICTHPGTSQYSQGGPSACGIASMNCIRHILTLEREGKEGDALITVLLQRETMEDIMSICAYWTSNAHLEVDCIYKTPLFESSLKHTSTSYGKSGEDKFEEMLRQLDGRVNSSPDARHSCAVVITRPPEIVVCLKIAHPKNNVYVIFDSHPRPAHPTGAAFIFHTSRSRATRYLTELFSVDARLLAPNSGLQWQAELLSQVQGDFFECGSNDMRMSFEAEHALFEANFALLAYKAQESEVTSQCRFLTSENERLKLELDHAEEQAKHERATRNIEQEELRELRDYKKLIMQQTIRLPIDHSAEPIASSQVNVADGGADTTTINKSLASNGWRDSDSLGESSSSVSSISMSSGSHRRATIPRRADSFSASAADVKGKGKESDLGIAMRIQMKYQEEDEALSAQLRYLQATAVQETFDCSICMDTLPLDFVARIDGCRHMICRECIRQYISSKLQERKYPIPCPCCTAQDESENAGMITETLILQVGIPSESYSIFVELQMAAFSIPMECKKCKRSAFVDRLEFDETKILACPFPNCTYLWCKDCQQEVPLTADGPPHSCDGSAELQHLMTSRGWKHCPGCRTPTEKIDGCNHMTCCSPGCNTHFCYICGGLIVKSTQRAEINSAVGVHYRARCTLFDIP